ncbi:MAG: 1-acyl-sn-glycerol-3-phosphate acyltransferase [Tannerella sp.]|jgi:1-acyl-sn-glycerol-3-phosphate acyltransferase|nr:1-acyl-sn-glycerol-3-phosphate acyltransferase [Tannerella sp.]
MTKFFLSVYDFFSQRRGLLFTLLSLFVVLLALSAYHIRFKEDISRFLPENKENERINNAYQYVASSNTITVYCNFKIPETGDFDMQSTGERDSVSGGQAIMPTEPSRDAIDAQTAAIDALAERLQSRMDASYIKSIFYSINPTEMLTISSFVIDNMPYFLGEDDYGRMDTLLSREAIARQLLIDKNVLTSSAGMIVRNNFLYDPLQMTGGLMRKLQSFRVGDQFQLYDDHLFNGENQAVMFIDCAIPASETGANAIFLDSLNSFITETEKEFANITFDSFGASEIGLTNARQIQKDTMFSMTLAVIIMFALLIYSFRSGRKILLIFTSVLFGGLFALAMLNIISGDVSIIAVGISSIMFGIAINYPLHFMQHYNHVPDSRIVIKDIIEPLTIGNITTVGAFMSLVFIGSDAMRDLGLFASLLLIGTILFVLFFLPHFLASRGKKQPENISVEDKSLLGRFIARPFEKNRWLVLSVILLTIFFSFFSGNSGFETNMQKINYMTASQKKSFEKMMGLLNKNQHVMYYVTEGKDLEAALEANESQVHQLQSLVDNGEIYRIGGVGVFFPSRVCQAERIKRWEEFWSTRSDSVMTFLQEESRKIGFREDAFQTFEEMVSRKWDVVDLSHFNPIRETLAKNYIIEKGDNAVVVNMLYTDASRVQELEEKLNSYASSSIAFDAGSITRRMISSLSDDFNYVLYVCGIIVFAFLIFSLGRIELSLIAFLPLALSWIWILGMMSIFDIRFNIVNIILATFIFGQGDDYTIFMTEGLMYEYTYRRKMLASYKKSIALSALIMFIGMGMLIFAKHPALRSLAEVTIVGMLSVVIMAYIFPSLLFHLLTMKKGKKRLMPVTLKNLLCTIYSFSFFLIMSTIITIAGWMMFTFGRTTEEKKRKYHRLLHRIAHFVIYRIPQVKTTFRNLSGETFDKPAVIICNHQAHLDLMCIMMLTPKLIILTNDWVWNSPFYGRLIKYADFYPVSNGIENAIDQLQDAINRGYSIVIFPEGTRSSDCSIRRFHRGAFYLAEQLKLDIIPVMIHGVGHVLPKEEFMLRKGQIHIQVMPRITPDDERFHKDYSPRSIDVRHYYQAEYKKLSKEVETPDYYADLVLKNYIYKGPAIERAVRRNLKKHNNYTVEIAAMPDEGEVTIQNTGYGEYALLLSLVKKKLRITVVEPNSDTRALAENCASVQGNLRYEV